MKPGKNNAIMKKMIYPALFITEPFFCFSREKAREQVILKNRTGITRSGEFPDSIKSSKISLPSDTFHKDFLKT